MTPPNDARALMTSHLTKSFGADIPAVHDLDLNVADGEILALLGPSGCGKTTTLRMIAGFVRPDQGEIMLRGKYVVGKGIFAPPEKRGLGMVFQEHALFPHLTVVENVAYGLERKEKDRAEFYLRLIGMERFKDRFPHEISGGERQRVAVARALAPSPVMVLLDEPFSNLDAERRLQIREEVRAILKSTGSSALFVTHDQEEAMFMGDRLAVMKDGRLSQVGRPEQVFHSPSTRFVAEFLGNTDFLPGEVVRNGVMTEIGLHVREVDLPLGTPVELALRFDDVTFRPDSEGDSMVLARHFKGAYNIYRLRLPSGRLLHAMQPHVQILRPGTPVQVTIEPGHPLACFYNGLAVA
jgi:iron(III) transport system ATP-binding protein